MDYMRSVNENLENYYNINIIDFSFDFLSKTKIRKMYYSDLRDFYIEELRGNYDLGDIKESSLEPMRTQIDKLKEFIKDAHFRKENKEIMFDIISDIETALDDLVCI